MENDASYQTLACEIRAKVGSYLALAAYVRLFLADFLHSAIRESAFLAPPISAKMEIAPSLPSKPGEQGAAPARVQMAYAVLITFQYCYRPPGGAGVRCSATRLPPTAKS
jgi:hypothetical protein